MAITPKYLVLPAAEMDLRVIWDYIAQDSLRAAGQMEVKFYDAFEKLAEHPHMGHTRKDLTKRPLRFWAVHSYLIIYKPDSKPLEIIRILSGFRDIAGLL